MAGVDDRVEISTAIAVRGDMGFFFGSLRWIESGRLSIQLDAELESGDSVDVRITLAPTTATALLYAVVARPLVTAKTETPGYVLDIIRMAPNEQALLEEWTHNIRNRGTFSKFSTAATQHSVPPSGGGQSNADVRSALERMARRGTGTPSSGPADPFGVRSDIVTGSSRGGGAERITGRGAMRDALHGAIARGAAARSSPGAPTPAATTPTPPSERNEGLGRVVASGGTPSGFGVPTADRPARDPSFATVQTHTASWMQVSWHSPAAFDRDARVQLCNYVLQLEADGEPLPDKEPLRIMLCHAGLQLECAATVRAHGTRSASYRLMLDGLQVAELRQWGLDYAHRS